ncbi:2-methylcitrate synthase [Leucobacter sp. OLJS4]|uniref:bifunctional 2-methylcitrate synthase/citrate synthase n=1 Tax=unclassified Leucobacter TaxID=2621730 RepID=UPI000C192C26|nr:MULTISPECIES: bifunctional 2-methylcitrate synthase/citrate synthase [unclassified Leucobacter]PII83309.1 2-methylcitrate synthase [Leucobacter sp. OLCALW19]PII86860.1 2-methylcitrate synthase [Leucobacter sp. OLTLW20]PII91204.1 2-methylcitrate synthase [Leucobacter sp. OLAS13]PII98663.1 2-methylcitrate synthase [Leucobacter sp. OLDS2]PIJ04022.1 2-methylcitrate synthase [Leucobacter sp. OLIS6]
MTDTEIKKGLAGVVVDTTAISKVNPESNSLLYRGYPVQELAASQPFEAVAYLLWHGELPTPEQLASFEALERSLRPLDPRTLALLGTIPSDAHPMDIVRTAVSQLGTFDETLHRPGGWTDRELDLGRSAYLFAQLPTIVAAVQRRRRGQEPIPPRDDLDYARNFLWMTFGELPSDAAVDVFRVSMVLYAEHSFNASTFTARVIASTTSDLYSAVVGAIGALKGPLHGGANEAVMHIFDEIGSADAVDAWLDRALAEKRKIMGFGHRVYKHGDSRVPTMDRALRVLLDESGDTGLSELYETLEREFVARKGIYPNLDYPSGPAYRLLGFDTEIFTPLFIAARVTGWTAHIMEQAASNALIRPLSAYDGVDERHVPGA